ncbi:hypothetical protein SLEP1_g31345 [Rubroshorea leprosula]|uniref:Reverse transcriptase domain-containing protein n=1 Tax=Rubroshorea leprosula TaxID=152421 RepID=A0AAV5KAB3_9ROSI|nr:hypothetical protein SLEP1_g31345 [Rubroshorea leprosula]
MYYYCFESLGLNLALLQKYDGPIYGFNNQPVPVEGVLRLNVAFGLDQTYVTPSICSLHLWEWRLCNQEIARHCYMTSVARPQKDNAITQPSELARLEGPSAQQVMGVELPNNGSNDETKAISVEEVKEVQIDDNDPIKKTSQVEHQSPEEACSSKKTSVCGGWYHKVHMAPEDEAKASFYARDEIYYYVMMLFRLKNAGVTYQKMVTIVLRAQIGRNLEVYVDDIVVKSLKVEDHLVDLADTFDNLRKHNIRLNFAKCVFSVESTKFLRFMVFKKGIEVNHEKIKAIEEMKLSKSIKDVQHLIGRVAALHKFISKSAYKCLPFFKVLRAFDELKTYLNLPPLLTKAEKGEILYLYLGISDITISSILVREMGKQQRMVYYTSKILSKPECSGRLIKWAVELGEF